jgi:arylformamidase
VVGAESEDSEARSSSLSRRTVFGAAAALAAGPALAETCQVGPPPHTKGPLVWRDMDQIELNAAYDQSVYAPLQAQIQARYITSSDTTRQRLGAPKRFAYGPSAIEGMDVYPAREQNAPVFVFIHGGAWRGGLAKDYGFPADLFVNAGVTYIALDFISVTEAGGDLRPMADQVRHGIAWAYRNAASYGGNPKRFHVGGHSSGGHLCGVAMVTDWQASFGLPNDMLAGGLLMSGMYDLKPARLSARSSYVKFDDEMEDALSSIRHLDQLRAPIIVTYGTNETPEFQRQARDFVTAVKTAGKPVQLAVGPNFNHFEMCESLGNPYGPNGYAARQLIGLA